MAIPQGSNDSIILPFDQDISGAYDISIGLYKNGVCEMQWGKEDVNFLIDNYVEIPFSQTDTANLKAGRYDVYTKLIDSDGNIKMYSKFQLVIEDRPDRGVTLRFVGELNRDGIIHEIKPVENTVRYRYVSPYVGDDGYWYEYDVDTQKFVNSGFKAIGQKGDPGETTYIENAYDDTNVKARLSQAEINITQLANSKQDAIQDIDDIRSGSALGATSVQPRDGMDLFTWDYNDLKNKPSIPEEYDDSGVRDMLESLDQVYSEAVLQIDETIDNIIDTLDGKQDKLTGANGITINDGVIASDFSRADAREIGVVDFDPNNSYVNGTIGNEIAALNNAVVGKQNKLTAGNYINIRGNTISVNGLTNYDDAAVKSDIKSIKQNMANKLDTTAFNSAISSLASTSYVDGKVAALVNSAPDTLDTLKELSDALGGDHDFATTVATQIGEKQDKLIAGNGISINGNTISATVSANYDDTAILDALRKKLEIKDLWDMDEWAVRNTYNGVYRLNNKITFSWNKDEQAHRSGPVGGIFISSNTINYDRSAFIQELLFIEDNFKFTRNNGTGEEYGEYLAGGAYIDCNGTEFTVLQMQTLGNGVHYLHNAIVSADGLYWVDGPVSISEEITYYGEHLVKLYDIINGIKFTFKDDGSSIVDEFNKTRWALDGTTGSEGQVLTRTEYGAQWGDAPSGDKSVKDVKVDTLDDLFALGNGTYNITNIIPVGYNNVEDNSYGWTTYTGIATKYTIDGFGRPLQHVMFHNVLLDVYKTSSGEYRGTNHAGFGQTKAGMYGLTGDGSVGQVLTRTKDGAEWKDAIGGTDSNVVFVEEHVELTADNFFNYCGKVYMFKYLSVLVTDWDVDGEKYTEWWDLNGLAYFKKDNERNGHAGIMSGNVLYKLEYNASAKEILANVNSPESIIDEMFGILYEWGLFGEKGEPGQILTRVEKEDEYGNWIGAEWQDAPTSGYVASATEPEDKNVLWIDTSDNTSDGIGSGGVSDVQINGASIVEDGVASLPIFGSQKPGLISFWNGYGLQQIGDHLLIQGATADDIDKRTANFNNGRCPITQGGLDYAVKAAMCDGKGSDWTSAERQAAKSRLGIDKWELIANLNFEEDVRSWVLDTDLNGQPFKLKAFILYIHYPKAEANTGYAFLNVYDETDKMQRTGIYTSMPIPSASYFRDAYVELDCESKIERYGYRDNTNTVTNINQLVNYNDNPLNYNVCKIEVVYGNATVVATAGTIIKVYGVRA